MSTQGETTAASEPQPVSSGMSGGRRFITNILWNWLGAISTIATGLLLQPYIVRQLGTARYGIWALVFSTLDYLRLFDFGFRASVVNFSARHRARGDHEGLNNLLSTAAAYFGMLGIGIIAFTLAFAPVFPRLFKVPAEYQTDAVFLTIVVGISVSIGLFSSIFTGTLEGFQRFDLVNHAYTTALFVRMAGSVALLYLGYGLVELGILTLLTQTGERVWNIVNVCRIFPQINLRPRRVSRETLRSITGYGSSSFLISNATIITSQSPLILIGYFASAAMVGFFSLPYRLVMYVGDMVPRVGSVTTSKVTELEEHGQISTLRTLTVTLNRYCLTLFLPVTAFLLVYGHELLTKFIDASFAATSGVVLAPIALMVTFTMAGMFNTQAALVGQGRHRGYAWGLVVEVIVYIAVLSWSIPRYGIAGAAYSALVVLTCSRGLLPAWLWCRQNGRSVAAFLASIYVAPLLTAAVAGTMALLIKARWLPGSTWPELIAGGTFIAAIHYSLAIFTCLPAEHRKMLFQTFRRQLARAS